MSCEIPIVEFGKYKGRPLTDLISDRKYLDWCKSQDGLLQRYPNVYNIIYLQSNTNHENNPTPEHNKLQNRFLNSENVVALVRRKLGDERLVNKDLSSFFSDPTITSNFGTSNVTQLVDFSKSEVEFEAVFNWDLSVYVPSFSWSFDSDEKEREYFLQEGVKEEDKLFESVSEYVETHGKYLEGIHFEDLLNILRQKQFTGWSYSKNLLQETCTHKSFTVDELNVTFEKHCKSNETSPSSTKRKFAKEKPLFPHFVSAVESALASKKYEKRVTGLALQTYSQSLSYNLGINTSSAYANTYSAKELTAKYNNYKKYDQKRALSRKYDTYKLDKYNSVTSKYDRLHFKLKEIEDGYFKLPNGNFNLQVNKFYSVTILCEIKPVVGDEYPCVLRDMKNRIRLTHTNDDYKCRPVKFCLLLEHFNVTTCTKEEFITIFKQTGIDVIFTTEIFGSNTDKSRVELINREITKLKQKIQELEQEKLSLEHF